MESISPEMYNECYLLSLMFMTNIILPNSAIDIVLYNDIDKGILQNIGEHDDFELVKEENINSENNQILYYITLINLDKNVKVRCWSI